MTIIKRIVYGFISQNCRVYKDKTSVWTDRLDNKFIFDFFEKMNYFYLLDMYKELSITLEQRVKTTCRDN